MSRRFADFRSDTVTRPTPRMLAAMAAAEVGDAVLGDDPTVDRLERRMAELFGHEAALFMPSGTMSNQCAVAAHIEPGEEVVVEASAHVFQYEGGGLARVAGAHVRTIAGEAGTIPLEELRAAVRPPSVHMPRTALVCVEQTHLQSGGAILPRAYLEELRALSLELGLPVHMDGARIFNAVAETGIEPAVYGAACDSLSVSLCKGLSCPVGSVLIGRGAFIERAKRIRKWLGGGMRQAGYLAACALVALDEVLPLLSEDNARCRRLGGAVLAIPGLQIAQPNIDTNILFLEVTEPDLDAPMVEAALRDRGVLALAVGPRILRFVTHRLVDDADVDRAVQALSEIFGASAAA
ncbi:MAG: aminotransferase class I/II-fold pyridoxal phosphate-dependent enzyme [Planctomycetota bacterium]|nr:MAG: aminotransferase class I/II-fold pyridoxal phosphate-dependent enzyme [Planctomycetota bacterium]